MKRLLFITLILSLSVGCKNDKTNAVEAETSEVNSEERTAKQSDGLTLLKGEFVYYEGAAVLQTHAEIYGVLLTGNFDALNTQAEKYKKAPTDMVNVEIRGKITNDKHDKILWENKVEVVEILNVSKASEEENTIIKLGD